MKRTTIILDGRTLSRDEVVVVARGQAGVELDAAQLTSVARAAAFLAEQVRRQEPIYGVSTGFGWQVPAYTMPDGAKDVSVLRVVVREGLSADLARSLWEDLHAVLDNLDALQPEGHFTQAHFAH